ncbi:MAG TPA: sigma-70 family RNA polymerase sigma factor [Woeseiaceae bacterium]|jgi:RNA polymerase sigma-70 factor (ECF subfamily)|nr:sigma-70 family RNA polymerase sigma factor [Woeseiaceae bacterium]
MAKPDDTRAFFSQGVEENMDALYRTALRLTGSGADAEDLVAESVSKAWAAIDSLDDRSRFRPWVFRILHNMFISNYRKLAARPLASAYHEDSDEVLATLLNEQPDEFLVWWANPERQFFNEVLGETIMAAIGELPLEFRMTIVLINIEGLKYDEAAEVLGVPAGTVRSRMKRGRTLLQKALWQQARDAGLAGNDSRDGKE